MRTPCLSKQPEPWAKRLPGGDHDLTRLFCVLRAERRRIATHHDFTVTQRVRRAATLP
jgi:hypothetical protein